jgi:periplasmic protein TonB
MNTTTFPPHVRSLYVFLIASVLIHALLLLMPFASAVVPKVPTSHNRLIAVELLVPELKAENIRPERKAGMPPAPLIKAPKKVPAHTIEKRSTASKESSHTQPREATVSLDRMSDSDVQYRSYLGHLRSKIGAVWEYPPAARDKGLNGVVTVRFTIARNGRLEALSVKSKSPYLLLDDEALRTIRAAAPFLPFPSEFSIETLHVTASFEYEFSGG